MLSDDDVLSSRGKSTTPDKKQQPSADEKSRILHQLLTQPDHLHLPQFGNYVDHGTLFGKRLSHVTPLPRRAFGVCPALYDGIMPRLEKITGLANGLNLLDGPDFKDYAAPYFLDEAATAPLLSNAKKIAAALVGQNSRDKIFKELVKVDAHPLRNLSRSPFLWPSVKPSAAAKR